jgi:hypothetical protein
MTLVRISLVLDTETGYVGHIESDDDMNYTTDVEVDLIMDITSQMCDISLSPDLPLETGKSEEEE